MKNHLTEMLDNTVSCTEFTNYNVFDPASVCVSSQLCVVMIFLVTVVMCRGIISVMMFHTGSPVLRTEVYQN